MKIALIYLKKLALVSFFILSIDGCVYRDPHVMLPHGYWIGSIASSIPCDLGVPRNVRDSQKREWTTSRFTRPDGTISFSLEKGDEILEFDNEADWKAVIEMQRRPDLEAITAFATDDEFLIGRFQDGYFLLEYDGHQIHTFDSQETWAIAVSKQTELSIKGLRNPSSFLAQYRHPVFIGLYTVMFLAAIGFAVHESQPERQRVD